MSDTMLLLFAVAAGWCVQLFMTYRQSMAFNKEVVELRRHGRVTVGVAGKRYRGGRAFVALAFDDDMVVRKALALQGFTTFTRARPLPSLDGVPLAKLRTDDEVAALSRQQRDASREAANSVREYLEQARAEAAAKNRRPDRRTARSRQSRRPSTTTAA